MLRDSRPQGAGMMARVAVSVCLVLGLSLGLASAQTGVDGGMETLQPIAQQATLQPVAQAEPASAPEAGSMATTDLTQINRAIFLYVSGDYQAVIDLLADIEQRQIQSGSQPDVTVIYYLGLAYMEVGLAETLPEEKARLFNLARNYLQQVYVDPQIRRAELALTLSAVQAAAAPDVQGPEAQQALDAYYAAFETIDEYIRGDGDTDPYGHFFHAVAAWRISFYGKKTRSGEARAYANTALTSLSVAMSRADTAITNPEDLARFRLNVQYYRALLAASDRQYQDAADLLRAIADDPSASVSLKANAQQLITTVEDFASQPQVQESADIVLLEEGPIGPLVVRGNVGINNGWDQNVILLGRRAAIPPNIPDDEDYFAGILADLEVSRRFDKQNDGLQFGESFTLGVYGETRHSWHPSIREYDENEYAGSLFFTWEMVEDLYFGMEYRFTEIQLGHKPFISSHRAVPAIWKDWCSDQDEILATTMLYYIYDYRSYTDKITDPRLDRDGHYNTIVLSQSFNLHKATDLWPDYYAQEAGEIEARNAENRWLSVSAEYAFENYATIGTEFDMFSHGAGFGLEVPFPYRLTLDMGMRFSWDNYTAKSIFDPQGDGRYDFRHIYAFELRYQLVERGEVADFPSLSVAAKGYATWELSDSNITDRYGGETYTYTRGIYGVGLEVSF